MGRITMPRAAALGGAVLAIIAFFLPWVQYGETTYLGLGLATAVTKAGGLKGFDVALYAVPILALVSIAFTVLSSRAAGPPAGVRVPGPPGAAPGRPLPPPPLFLRRTR